MKRCKEKAIGRIHSLESFGTHEGPGIRYVVFLQGCVARCLYCQNPDTRDLKAGTLMSAKEVFKRIERCLPYIRSSKGGVTVSGGEPLLQADFVMDLFRMCRKNAIHTAVDTSGFYPRSRKADQIEALMGLTDLFLMDIKAATEGLHKKITSRPLDEALSFIYLLEAKKRPYWLRYVLVPGLNDSKKAIDALRPIILGLRYAERFEFLPYHVLGRHKWKYLGLKYRLSHTPPATDKDIRRARNMLFTGKSLINITH